MKYGATVDQPFLFDRKYRPITAIDDAIIALKRPRQRFARFSRNAALHRLVGLIENAFPYFLWKLSQRLLRCLSQLDRHTTYRDSFSYKALS